VVVNLEHDHCIGFLRLGGIPHALQGVEIFEHGSELFTEHM
jgi:hypothetical protein